MNTSRKGRSDNVSSQEADGAALLSRIRELSFVQNELVLYLDTHPDCRAALDYYERVCDELGTLMEQYQTAHAPIIAAGGDNSDGWAWVKHAWPWQSGHTGGGK